LVFQKFLSPLHPDGIKFVLAAAGVTLLLFILWSPLGWLALLVTVWIGFFFRDPWRVTPTRSGLIVSPADGVVLSVAAAQPPPELVMGAGDYSRIAIFLNILDVHVIRAPLGGRVADLSHVRGRFINASFDKASEHNERLMVRIAPPEGPDIAFVMIAGLLARRIVCDLYEGRQLATGQRVGIIRFGSRVDIYCPAPYVPLVIEGQRMIAGETVLADREAMEPARKGVAQ
jgi:phosphatidylserine decarboxylase